MAERRSKHPTDKLLRPTFGVAISEHRAELPIKTDDFLAGTAHMSPEQLGCYCRLLFTILHGGRIPETEAEFARISGVSLRRWRAIGKPVRRLAVFSQKRLSPRHLRLEAPPAPAPRIRLQQCRALRDRSNGWGVALGPSMDTLARCGRSISVFMR